MKSLWNITSEKPLIEKTEQRKRVDVLIIGGGIAGILCAHYLKKSGAHCLIVESDKICGGVTQNTTAKITFQHGLIYNKIEKKYGLDMARMYYESQKEALREYRGLCFDIDCDFEDKDSYVYSLNNRTALEKEAMTLNRLGCDASVVDSLPLPLQVEGAVRITGQAQFHPLKLLYTIAKDIPIIENTRVVEITPDGVITNRGKIYAEKIVVATHFPFVNKHGSYFLKMYQHRSYVIALENAPEVNGMYVDENKTGLSFRNYNHLLLLGGGSHKTGKQGGNWQTLRDFAKRNYRNAREVAYWATQDCMTLDGMPYIGQYSKRTPNLYVATGFNKWGMTSSMVAALILKDLVLGRENEYAAVYSPSRSIVHGQLAVNAFGALTGLLTPTAPRCPHMGCALKYNKYEHSWDCSCHGSRFTKDGKLLDNPATKDKNM